MDLDPWGVAEKMFTAVTNYLDQARIIRQRTLSEPARVLVRKGQTVAAVDPVTESIQGAEHLWLDVVLSLGITTGHLNEYLQCKVGDQLAQGDLLAGPAGLLKRILRSPADGQVVLITDRAIVLEKKAPAIQLKAGISGQVVDLVPEQGAVIQTEGALVQGVWGNGKIGSGRFTLCMANPAARFTLRDLDPSLQGALLGAGSCDSADVLNAATGLNLAGLVVTSLEPDLIPLAGALPFPLVVVEGFGTQVMNTLAYQIFTERNGQAVDLNAEPFDRQTGFRPEAVFPDPLPAGYQVPSEMVLVSPGHLVRILRPPYHGRIGRLEELLGTVEVQGGYLLPAGRVLLSNGEAVTLPLVNLQFLS